MKKNIVKMNKPRTVMTSPYIVYIDNDRNPKFETINFVDEFKQFIKTIPDTWDVYDDKANALSYYNYLIKNIDNLKLQNEADITTDITTYKQNKYDIDNEIEDGETLSLTSANEGVVDESLKLPISDVINSLGINLNGKSLQEKEGIMTFIKQMMSQLQSQFGVGPLLGESDEKEEFQDPDLFGDEERAEREMDEGFDELMENLSKQSVPTIDITENKKVNPRIKKSDLIEYYKNKK